MLNDAVSSVEKKNYIIIRTKETWCCDVVNMLFFLENLAGLLRYIRVLVTLSLMCADY